MKSIFMAFTMFSRIPAPMVEWNDQNRRFLLAAFPLVGVAIGFMLWLWQLLCVWLRLSQLLWGAGCILLPLLITGGIHMDGFADTVDALSSHAEPEKKRKILKDPNAGAFAVIAVAAYVLFYFALAQELPCNGRTALCLAAIHMLSRTASGLISLLFPSSAAQGLLTSFRQAADKRACAGILLVWLLILCAAVGILMGWKGLLLPGACAILAVWLYHMSRKEFGGMSGDLSGYFLCVAEIVMLAIAAVLSRLSAL